MYSETGEDRRKRKAGSGKKEKSQGGAEEKTVKFRQASGGFLGRLGETDQKWEPTIAKRKGSSSAWTPSKNGVGGPGVKGEGSENVKNAEENSRIRRGRGQSKQRARQRQTRHLEAEKAERFGKCGEAKKFVNEAVGRTDAVNRES